MSGKGLDDRRCRRAAPTCRQCRNVGGADERGRCASKAATTGAAHASKKGGRFDAMMPMRSVLLVVTLGVLAAPVIASAACRRFGTQLDCVVAGRAIVIGSQRDAEPTYAGEFRPQTFNRGRTLFDGRTRGAFPIELQNVARDASLCRTIGDETYCY
jgi:hypothetical protein